MWLEISFIALAAFIAFSFGRLSKKMDNNREDGQRQTQALEALKEEIANGKACEMDYMDKLGDMAYETATAARDKKLFNGQLNTVIENFEKAKDMRDQYRNKIAAKAVK